MRLEIGMLSRLLGILLLSNFFVTSVMSQEPGASTEKTKNFASKEDEQKARKELAQAILDGAIPLNRLPAKVTDPDRRVLAALETPCSINFEAKPLYAVLEEIADDHKIRVWLNTPELDLKGIPSNTLITAKASGIELRVLLAKTFRPLNLAFTVRNGALEITTNESADTVLINRLMMLPPELAKDLGSVLNAVQQSIEPEGWLAAGGNSSILPLGNLLILRAPLSTQYAVQDLLAEMANKIKAAQD